MSERKPAIDVDELVAQMRASLPPDRPISGPAGSPPPPVAEILRRVRHEIALRRGIASPHDDVATNAGDHRQALPRWKPAAEPVPMRDQYVLGEFLALDDADFVEEAYRCLLRRPADEPGFRHHLKALRQGQMSKVEVLASLRWSPEGEARGVHVDGLLLPTLLHRWKRRRFIGPLIGWLHAYVRLPSVLHRQQRDHLGMAREAHELGRHLNVVVGQVSQSLAGLEAGLSEALARLDQIESGLAQSGADNARLESEQTRLRHRLGEIETAAVAAARDGQRIESRVNALADAARSSEQEVGALRGELAGHLPRMDVIQASAEANQVAIGEIRDAEASQAVRFAELSAMVATLAATLADLQAAAATQDSGAWDHDALYARFEERFRGSEELVRTRVGQFLPMVQALGTDTLVADLGCGRGEWLQLMDENGVGAIGVDTNSVFVAHCRDRGLNVEQADAIAWLRARPTASVSGITSLHLVEHLPFEAMMELLREACRVITPGGLLLLETPNPENLMVSTLGFYMDPTHRNPLPPDMLAWLVQASGFEAVEVVRLTLARDLDAPPLLDAELPGAGATNVLLATLQAAPDYAVMARRP